MSEANPLSPEECKRILAAVQLEMKLALGRNTRTFGKKRAAAIMRGVTDVLCAAGEGRDPEETRDMVVEIFKLVQKFHTMGQGHVTPREFP